MKRLIVALVIVWLVAAVALLADGVFGYSGADRAAFAIIVAVTAIVLADTPRG